MTTGNNNSGRILFHEQMLAYILPMKDNMTLHEPALGPNEKSICLIAS